MEVFIILAVSYIGYEISRKQLENKTETIQNEKSIQNVKKSNSKQYENLRPFFKSEKSQNTNDNLKDNRLATFTGIDNIEFTHKKEHTQNFAPMSELTNVRGAQNNTNVEMKYYQSSHLHNNVLPFQQEKVGKGLGIPSHVSASGGLHDNFRILPDNVNAYRKHVYESRIVPGSSHVSNRSMDVKVAKNVDTVQEFTREVFPTHSQSKHQQTLRSDYTKDLKTTTRENPISDYSGIISGDINKHSVTSSQQTRLYDSTKYFDPANVNIENSGVGAYANTRYLMHDNQQLTTPVALNVGNYTNGVYAKNSTDNLHKNTLRGEQNKNQGFISNTDTKGIANYNYEVTNTQRNQLLSSYNGNAHNANQQVSRQYNVKNTQRSNVNNSSGPASSYISANTQYDHTVFTEHNARELVSTEYTPGAEG